MGLKFQNFVGFIGLRDFKGNCNVYNCCVVYIVVRVAWCVWRDECHDRRLTAEGFDGKPNGLCTMLYDILEQHHAISIARSELTSQRRSGLC